MVVRKAVRKAVIPAAGLGTRVLPATKAVPKELLPLADTPTIQYIVEEAAASGIEQITFVTSRTKRAIEDHFDEAPELRAALEIKGDPKRLAAIMRPVTLAAYCYVRQQRPLGLGHAVLCARPIIGEETFGVLLGDDLVDNDADPCLKQLIRVHERHGGCVLAVMRVPHAEVSRYGVVSLGERVEPGVHQITDLVEKPKLEEAPSDLIVIGRYVLTPSVFAALERTQAGAGGEIQLTDALCALIQSGERVFACEFKGKRYDTGDPVGLLTTSIAYALKRPDLAPGVIAYLKTLDLG
ncbi:MAG TPA: UTP--glucose-1-phosphate uridylyltransferase GalU [Ktedonobacterales bacterium]|jgi:UTP--glucose-1-phosphate uridylyltransferase|nr:UTP--glucose-1-phosphate uridylyltransferase GalU [Ktedonobacterales bacterium]